MDRFREMRLFLAVVEAGSFAKAAERTKTSAPAVTRAIAALENRLGSRLLTRTTRRLNLTEEGQLFFESCRRILVDLEQAEDAVSGAIATPRGHLTLTAPATLGRIALMPVLSDFLKRYETVSLTALLLDRVADLVDEGIDVAIRIGDLPDSSLVARRVGQIRRVLAASPEYLAERGNPQTMGELKHHDFISFTGLPWTRAFRTPSGGAAHSFHIEPRLEVNDALAAIDAAKAGDGIISAACYMVGRATGAGDLHPVLPDVWPKPVPVHLVYPGGRHVPPKVRAFVDFAGEKLPQLLETLSAPLVDTGAAS